MLEDILTITGAVFQTTQEFNHLGANPGNSKFEDKLFPGLPESILHLFLNFLNYFLNSTGMNPSVLNQLFQSNPGNLPSYRVKSGQGNRLRGIVNN
ncbi:hypothetical protein ES703_101996 [subsurface metagenome]